MYFELIYVFCTLRTLGYTWSHEMRIRRPAQIAGHSYDEPVQKGIPQMDLRSQRTSAILCI